MALFNQKNMSTTKIPRNFVQSISPLISPAQCVKEVVQSLTDYLKVAEEEKTKRREIGAWEKATIAEIQAKRDFLINYLEKSFDERAENFQVLFNTVDQAMSSGESQQLGVALHAIVVLAQSSPFKELADLPSIKAALEDPDHQWVL